VYATRRASLPLCTDRPKCRIYTAVSGDYMIKISKYFGVSEPQLEAMNPEITNPSFIRTGAKVRVPDR
jgi:LysM repeat protein